VLDHFNGRSTVRKEHNGLSSFITIEGLEHQDADVDCYPAQDEAEWACFVTEVSNVAKHLEAQEDAFGYLVGLGFSEQKAADLCRSCEVQTDDMRVRWPGGFTDAS